MTTYSIYKKHKTGKKELRFKSVRIDDIIYFFNQGSTELKELDFEQLMNEFKETVEDQWLYNLTFCEFVEHYGSMGELRISQDKMEKYRRGDYIIIYARNNTDTMIDICHNDEYNEFYAIRSLVFRMFEDYEIEKEEEEG